MMKTRLLVKGKVPPPLGRPLTVVGRSLNRQDAFEKVTGRAKYSGDIKLPDMLHAVILRCPYPRARIKKIDTSEAERLPGVKAVLTKENTKGWRTYWYDVPQIAFPELITYEGQEVAALAAEDIITARRALDLIDVEYEVFPPLIDAAETLRNSLPQRVSDEEYPGSDTYDRTKYVIKRGDTNKGFVEADLVLEDVYTTQAQYHGTIQTRACVASWDGHTLTMWDALQGLWSTKAALAKSLGLEAEQVRVIVRYIGGGFGSKASAQRISYYAARLSMSTGRPVRLERSRSEEFMAHPRRWICKVHLKMGAKKDGKLTAITQTAILNVGAAANARTYYADKIIWHTANLYACPNVHLEQVGVFTNLQLTGPQRAPMNAPAIFALESHVDKMAVALGIDPLEFRLKNYINHHSNEGADEAIRHTEGLPPVEMTFVNQPKNIPYSAKNLDKCMALVTKAVGWKKRSRLSRTTQGTKRTGIGMASFVAFQGVGIPPYEAHAHIDILNNGTVNLRIGIVEIGGGQQTVFAMIAAEELGIKLDDVMVILGDTQGTPYAPACHVSRCTAEMAPAVLQAASNARQKLFRIAAPVLGVKAKDLSSKNGKIYVKSKPSRSITFKKACSMINPRNPIHSSGSRAPNPASPLMAAFGAQAVKLEVDVETGEVAIQKVAVAHEFGRALNPKFCTSQIYGGVEFGIGYALLEEGIFDNKTGKMLNNNLSHYRMPTSRDFPHVQNFIVEDEEPFLAYSAKGGGENANTPLAAAIGNALHDALGIWCNDLPMTPDKIVKALQEQKKGGSPRDF